MHNTNILGKPHNYTTGFMYAKTYSDYHSFFLQLHDSFYEQCCKDWDTGKIQLHDLGIDLGIKFDILSSYYSELIHYGLKEDAKEISYARYDALILFFRGFKVGLGNRDDLLQSKQSSLTVSSHLESIISQLGKMWGKSYDHMHEEFNLNPPLLPKKLNHKV